MRWLRLITAFLGAALFRVQAAPRTPAEIPFQFREGLIWVAVHIPQSVEPLNFLLDTGASASVINLRTAQRLGLKQGKKARVIGVHSTTVGYWPTRLASRLGGLALPEDYLAVDLQKLSEVCDSPVDGRVGVEFFRDRIVQADFAGRKIRVFSSESQSFPGEVVPLEIRGCAMRLPLSVNGGKSQWTRLDTGCASPLQWVPSNLRVKPRERRIAVGLDRVSIAQLTTRVRIGTTDIDGVPTGLHTKEIFPGEAGLLGNGILARFSSVTIDAISGRVILGPRLIEP